MLTLFPGLLGHQRLCTCPVRTMPVVSVAQLKPHSIDL